MSTYDELLQMNEQVAAPLSQEEESEVTDTVVLDETGLESIIARLHAVETTLESAKSRNPWAPSNESHGMVAHDMVAGLEGRIDDYMSRVITSVATFVRRLYKQILRLIDNVRFRKQGEKEKASFEMLENRVRSMGANLSWEREDKEWGAKYAVKVNSASLRIKEAMAEMVRDAKKLGLMIDLEKLTGGKTYGADAAKKMTDLVNKVYRGIVTKEEFENAKRETSPIDGLQDDTMAQMFSKIEELIEPAKDLNLDLKSADGLSKATEQYFKGRQKHRNQLQTLIAQAEKRAGALADPAIDKAYMALQQLRINVSLPGGIKTGDIAAYMKKQSRIFAAMSNLARTEKLYIDSIIQADRILGGWKVPSEGKGTSTDAPEASGGKVDGVIDGSDVVDAQGNPVKGASSSREVQ